MNPVRRASLCLILFAVAGCGEKPPAPTRAEQIRIAEAAVKGGRYREAADAYGKAAADGQPDGVLFRKQAEALVRAGDFPNAMWPARRAADLLPDDVDAQLLAATILQRRTAFEEVVERLEPFLAKHPEHADAMVIMANAMARLTNSSAALNAYLRADDEREFDAVRATIRRGATSWGDRDAEQVYQRAIATSPRNTDLQMAMVNFLLAAGRADDAAATLDRLTATFPGRVRAHHLLGLYYLRRGKVVEAESNLKKAIRTEYGGRPLAVVNLASLYMDVMREDEARALLDSVMSEDEDREISMRLARLELRARRPDRAVSRLNQILAHDQNAADAAVLKVDILLREGTVDEALTVARSTVRTAPRLADARSALGRALSRAGDKESAFDEFAEAVRLAPGNGAHVTELARLALTLGRREALAFARDAARLDADNPQAMALPARALVLDREYDAAERELVASLRRSQAAGLFALFGTVKAAQADEREARASFARALALAPDSLEAATGMALLEVKDGLVAAGRRRIEQILAAHPRDPEYLRAAAQVYAAAGDQAAASLALEKALAADRSDLAAALALLTPAFTARHPEKARAVLERLLEVRPRAIDARYELGLLYERSGRSAAAAQQYRGVLAESPRPDTEMIRSMATIRLRALESAGG